MEMETDTCYDLPESVTNDNVTHERYAHQTETKTQATASTQYTLH